MKKLATAAVIVLLLSIVAIQIGAQTSPAPQLTPGSEELLTNKAVIDLVAAKLPEEVIIAKIQRSRTSFDFSTPALLELNRNGVSGNIVTVMMAMQPVPQTESSDTSTSPHDTASATVPAIDTTPPESGSESLASAKTLCVVLVSGNPVLKSELNEKLSQWGKLKVVSSPDNADLVLEVTQTGDLNLVTGTGFEASVLLREQKSGEELWSKSRGGGWQMSGFSNTWVAHALAKEFIRFYEARASAKHK